MDRPTVGTQLGNGATVVAATDTHVLAWWPLGQSEDAGEYITWGWYQDTEDGTYYAENGNYYQHGSTWGRTQVEALSDALSNFRERARA